MVRYWLLNSDVGCGLRPVAGMYRVIITASGFEPQTVNVEAGDAVQWINESGGDASVNSDPYPTNQYWIFLNLGQLPNGDGSALAAICSPGTYTYHNEVNPSQTGSIVAS
jgi:plastocyanin